MDTDDEPRWLEVAGRILRKDSGGDRSHFTPAEIDILILDVFLSDYENGGLSGYLFNRSPDFGDLAHLIPLLHRLGRTEMAGLMQEVLDIVTRAPADFKGTWGERMALADPGGRLVDMDLDIQRDYSILWQDVQRLATLEAL